MKKIIIVCTLIVLLLPCSLFAQGMKRLKSGYLIAVSEEAFDRCLSMVMNHDDAALGKMVSLDCVHQLKQEWEFILKILICFQGPRK